MIYTQQRAEHSENHDDEETEREQSVLRPPDGEIHHLDSPTRLDENTPICYEFGRLTAG